MSEQSQWDKEAAAVSEQKASVELAALVKAMTAEERAGARKIQGWLAGWSWKGSKAAQGASYKALAKQLKDIDMSDPVSQPDVKPSTPPKRTRK